MARHRGAPARRRIRFPTEGSVVTPGRARSCRATRGGVQRHDRGEDHVELVPEFDLVVLAAPRAALRVQNSSLQRLPLIAGPRSPWLAPPGRLGGPTANPGSLNGFRTVARKSRTTAPVRGQLSPRFRLTACSAQLQFPAIAGFPGRCRPKPEPFNRARLARRQAERPLRTFRKCRKTSTAQVYAR